MFAASVPRTTSATHGSMAASATRRSAAGAARLRIRSARAARLARGRTAGRAPTRVVAGLASVARAPREAAPHAHKCRADEQQSYCGESRHRPIPSVTFSPYSGLSRDPRVPPWGYRPQTRQYPEKPQNPHILPQPSPRMRIPNRCANRRRRLSSTDLARY